MHSWLAYHWDVRVIKQWPVKYFCIGCELRMVFIVLNHQVEGKIKRRLFCDIETWHKIQISVSINKVLLEQNVPVQFCSFVDLQILASFTLQLQSGGTATENIYYPRSPQILILAFYRGNLLFPALWVLQVLPCNVYGLLYLNISN